MSVEGTLENDYVKPDLGSTLVRVDIRSRNDVWLMWDAVVEAVSHLEDVETDITEVEERYAWTVSIKCGPNNTLEDLVLLMKNLKALDSDV